MKYCKNRLIASCADGSINFININTMSIAVTIQFSRNAVTDFDFFDNKKFMIIAGDDGFLRVWEVGTKSRGIFEAHSKAISGVIAIGNELIVTSSFDRSVNLWKKTGDLESNAGDIKIIKANVRKKKNS